MMIDLWAGQGAVMVVGEQVSFAVTGALQLWRGHMESSLEAAEHIFLLRIKTGSFPGQYPRPTLVIFV